MSEEVLHTDPTEGPTELPPPAGESAPPASSSSATVPTAGGGKRKRGRPKGSKTRGKTADKPAVRVSDPDVARVLRDDPEARALVEETLAEITSPDQLAEALCSLFAIPGALLDESFNLADEDGKPSQRAKRAARRLYPLVKRYGLGGIERSLPWLLAGWGLVELLKPCIGPSIAIATGALPPLVLRDAAAAVRPPANEPARGALAS